MDDPTGWHKLLWIKQDYADNYVPQSFLQGLERNRGVKAHEYHAVVGDCSVLALNIALTELFVCTFIGIYENRLHPQLACGAAAAFNVVLGSRWVFLSKNTNWPRLLKTMLLLTLVVQILSPVFLSLTRSTSSDSIWNLTSWLALAHLGFATMPLPPGRHTLIVATNMGLCATIVLASRLATSEQVFYFLMFSIQTYVLLPSFARWLRRHSPRCYGALVAFAMAVGACVACMYVGPWLAILAAVTQSTLLFGLPVWFIYIQKYKDQIEGPWDPAKPLIN